MQVPPAGHADHAGHAGPSRPRHQPGSGHLHLAHPASARFSTLRASYPLKLLAPNRLPSQPPHVATAYTLAYGGGLVAGDVVSLLVDVDDGCGLVLLTQGSTKVFKHRLGIRPQSHRLVRVDDGDTLTRQRLLVRLGKGAMLMLMPDSVSPFRSSRYSQVQRFELDRSASLLVLDWFNSGRGQRGPGRTFIDGNDQEVWVMDHYGSTNEVWIGDELVMRERQVISAGGRLAPYHVYGTLLIHGPAFAPLLEYLAALTDHTAQMQIHTPPSLLWAYSRTDAQGGVLRVAAQEVEDAKRWLREVLTFAGVGELVGEGLWPRVI